MQGFVSVLALQKKRRANKGKNKKPSTSAKEEKRKERYFSTFLKGYMNESLFLDTIPCFKSIKKGCAKVWELNASCSKLLL